MSINADYRETLRQELVQRCDRNLRYSLRAFARDLRLEPARLSDVLNGKKGFSKSVGEEIAGILGMNPKEREIFCTSIESQHARSRTARESAKAKLGTLSHQKNEGLALSLDTFKAVSDWYHFAILQLLKLPQSKSDASWMEAAV